MYITLNIARKIKYKSTTKPKNNSKCNLDSNAVNSYIFLYFELVSNNSMSIDIEIRGIIDATPTTSTKAKIKEKTNKI